jgi:hypothetical protein
MSNYWTTKEGEKIQVKDMQLSHVKNVLRMLIRKYTEFSINIGARHAPNIRLDDMSEEELRNMLDQTLADRVYLKKMVANSCFGYDVYSDIMNGTFQINYD